MFRELPALTVGDEIDIVAVDGSVVTFRVREVEQYPKETFPSEVGYGGTRGPELRLITGLGGNTVVFAERVESP